MIFNYDTDEISDKGYEGMEYAEETFYARMRPVHRRRSGYRKEQLDYLTDEEMEELRNHEYAY